MTAEDPNTNDFNVEWHVDGESSEKKAPHVTWESTPRLGELTLDDLKKTVAKYYPFYDFRVDNGILLFYCTIVDYDAVEEKFNGLKEELAKNELLPMLRYEHGEHVLIVGKKPPRPKKRSVYINLALLLATLVTTTLSGAMLMNGDFGNWSQLDAIFSFENLAGGAILFALPLMAILGFHEYGHYYVSKKHNVDATLPYFMPIPPNPVLPLGTLGAFISMHEPIPDKKALIDIGVAGPIAGFLVAIPVTILGLIISGPIDLSTQPGEPVIGSPLLFLLLTQLFTNVPLGAMLPLTSLNPMVFAGWVGLLVTSINLFPIGQLDGGHVAKALFGKKYGMISTAAVIALLVISFVSGGFWLFFILIVLLLGTQHPPPLNDVTELDTTRKYIGAFTLLILLLCFTPVPVYTAL